LLRSTLLTNRADRLLGIREVADLFGVDISTIRRWEHAGFLHSVRVGERGHRHYHAADIEELLESRAEGQERSQPPSQDPPAGGDLAS
jgi:excisionase family DNA binding protein